MRAAGWRLFLSPAKATAAGSTSSGTLVSPRINLALGPMRLKATSEVSERPWIGHDWTAITVRAHKVTYLYGAAYLTCSIGYTGGNVS